MEPNPAALAPTYLEDLNMTAVAAVSRTIKTMADGTLRLTVDVEPDQAGAAFALFGAGNIPMALAALNAGTEIPAPEPSTEPELKGGELARCAGMMIGNTRFIQFLCETGQRSSADNPDKYIKLVCGITSKRELDHYPLAAQAFHEFIRRPFIDWQAGL